MAKIFAVIALLAVVASGLELKNYAYEDLVVALTDGVPSTNCKAILENLEATLAGSSQYLFSALDGRAYLRSATVILPQSWPDNCTPPQVVASSGETPDITVLPEGPNRGRIWTQQSLGCGQPGDQIYMGYEGLKGRDDTLARTLVKQFATYRYGVFEEQGYFNDPIHPLCYYDDQAGQARLTGCSDLPIDDNGVCQGTNSEYNTTKMVSSKARTSILFAAEAPTVSMFCDEGNHNRLAPTKHNLICQQRSTLDVILNHPDFASNHLDNNQNSGQITDTTPKIVYKIKRLTRYVVIIENTKDMLQRESWSYLRNAIRKWAVYDLPENTEVGIVLMNDTGSQKILNIVSLKPTSDRVLPRDLVSSSIPYTPGDSNQPACLHCALRDARDMLLERTRAKGPANDVILVIAPGTVVNQQVKNAVKEIGKSKIKIATINYPGVMRTNMLDVLASDTNGVSFTVFEEKKNVESTLLTTYFRLCNALNNIVHKFYSGSPLDLPIEIHRREIKDDSRTSVSGSFMLDDNMGEPARFMLYTHNSESPLIKGIKLSSPTHQVFDSRSDNMLSYKIITVASNISEVGTWTYTIERFPGNPQPYFLQVMATPTNPTAPIVRTRFRTHRNHPGAPLVLLAEVKRGEAPVLDAKVEVIVTRPELNGTAIYKERFQLFDTGSGDPDITKGDGVYSRYFSAAGSGPGIYTFEAVVSDNGNTAYSYSDMSGYKDNKPCCGSVVPSPTKEPLAPFQRFLPPVTIEVTSDDIIRASQAPVGRILDLRAEVIPKDPLLRLTWTSPDMGGQMVSRYEIKYSTSINDILDKLETAAALWEQETPFILAPGSETTLSMNFTQMRALRDKPLYFVIKAYANSRDSKSGTVSNWVRVVVPSPPPPPTVPPTYASNDQSSWPFQGSGGGNDQVNASIASGSGFALEIILPVVIGFVLLVILLVLYCYFCVLKKRKSKKHKKGSKSDNNDKLTSAVTVVPASPLNTPSYNNYASHIDSPDHHTVGVPISNYGYEDETKKRYSLVHQQEQQLIEELKQQQMQNKVSGNNYSGLSVISNPSMRNGHTLSPYNSWSASQLLHEHERRHSPLQEEQMMVNPSQMDQMSLNAPSMDHVSLNGHYPPPVPPPPALSNGYPINYNIYGVHPNQPIYQTMQRNEPFNHSLQGSLSSVNSGDKKRRNVTMV